MRKMFMLNSTHTGDNPFFDGVAVRLSPLKYLVDCVLGFLSSSY